MRRLVDIGRSEARAVLLVIAPAARVVRRRHGHFPLHHRAHKGLVVGLTPSCLVADGLGRQTKMLCPLQQQFPDDQRPRGLLPGGDRFFRRMVLHLALNGIARDRDPVDADRHGFSRRKLDVHRARHAPTPPGLDGRAKLLRAVHRCAQPDSRAGRGTRSARSRRAQDG